MTNDYSNVWAFTCTYFCMMEMLQGVNILFLSIILFYARQKNTGGSSNSNLSRMYIPFKCFSHFVTVEILILMGLLFLRHK